MNRIGRFFGAFAAALSLFVLAGCFSDGNMQGGDDYPNSVEPMGKHAARERADSSEWNAYRDAPDGAPGMYDTTPVPAGPPPENAPKRGATVVLPSLDVTLGTEVTGSARLVQSGPDTAGVLRAVRTQTIAAVLFSAVDTTWYKVEGVTPRILRVSGKVSYAGDVRYTAFEDGDGDGYVSPTGAGSVVQMRFLTMRASGAREERTVRVSAGPDGDFNKARDNSLVSLRKTVVQALDTLLSLVLTDADGDGFLYNPLRDSSRIAVESKTRAPGDRTELSYRINIFADSTRNYAYRYRRVLTTAAGVEETEALGRDSMPDFAPGDSGSVRVRFTSTVAADTLASSDSRYAVRLSASPGNAAGNKLIQVDRVKTFRAGVVSGLRYRLKPDAAVADGSFARTGALFLRADLRAGGWVQLDGRADADMSGILTDSEGRSGTVHLRLDGTVKSASGF